jgi:hypothetical protein
MEFVFTSSKKLTPDEVESACSKMALQLTMKGSLKSLADNLHWHYKKTKQPGVLEITLMLNENKFILTCKKNRMGDWINKAAEELKQALRLQKFTD